MSPRLSAACAAALALAPLVAHAEFNLQVAAKWEPLRYTLPQIATSHPREGGTADPAAAAGTATMPSNGSLSAFQRQNLNATLGLGFTDQFTLVLGFDIARATLNHNDPDAAQASRGYTTIGLSLGAKYQFRKPRRETIVPYVYADLFKYFTALNDDRPGNLPQPEVEFSAGLVAPLGFRVAFGVEYWFTDGFGIGAEVFGLQGSFSSGSMRRDEGTPEEPRLVSHDQSLNAISFYSALTLNFRFTRLFGGRRYDRYERDRD